LVAAVDRLFPGVQPVPHPADAEAGQQVHSEMASGMHCTAGRKVTFEN
jgi:hypothetical protein